MSPEVLEAMAAVVVRAVAAEPGAVVRRDRREPAAARAEPVGRGVLLVLEVPGVVSFSLTQKQLRR